MPYRETVPKMIHLIPVPKMIHLGRESLKAGVMTWAIWGQGLLEIFNRKSLMSRISHLNTVDWIKLGESRPLERAARIGCDTVPATIQEA